MTVDQLPDSLIRQVTAEVFARAHFTRKRGWLDGLEIPLPDWSPRVWWTLLAVTLAMMVIAVLAQRLPQYGTRGALGPGGAVRGTQRDSWLLANEAAGRGDYVTALHALFAALVSTLGRAQQVDPHPAKTVGDYARELAARGSAIAAPFREFVAQYERSLYGGVAPDHAAFESLTRLALPLAASMQTPRRP